MQIRHNIAQGRTRMVSMKRYSFETDLNNFWYSLLYCITALKRPALKVSCIDMSVFHNMVTVTYHNWLLKTQLKAHTNNTTTSILLNTARVALTGQYPQSRLLAEVSTLYYWVVVQRSLCQWSATGQQRVIAQQHHIVLWILLMMKWV